MENERMNSLPIDPHIPWRSKSPRRVAWAMLLILCLATLAAVIIPVWLIMPFRSQTQSGLSTAFILRHWSPVFTLIAASTILVLTVWLWSGSRWWRKAILVLLLIPTLAATWFARQNHFEWMFNPLPNPAYVKVSDAGFVNDSDLVMVVENQGEAVAYPIRQMAYHHLVDDTVGGTPLVVTY